MPLSTRWIAAAAAALLAVVAGLVLRPRTPAPTLYRVPIDGSALDAALWMVERYPDYFEGVEGDDFTRWSASIPPHERVFVLSLAHALTWDYVDREARTIAAAADLGDLGVRATRRIRDATLNQLEVSIHDGLESTAANIDDPHFFEGALSRLVRGLSNCEGQNHLLLLILDELLRPQGARVAWIRSAEHTLVEVTLPGHAAPIYFDAWSNLPPYVLADRSDDPSIRTHAAIVAERPFVIPGRRGRIHERPERLDPAARPWETMPRPEALPLWPGPPPAGIDVRRPPIDVPALIAAGELRRLFYVARAHHLFGAVSDAIPIYQAIDLGCADHPAGDDYVCLSTRLYLDHLGATRRPIPP
ncbi:MAG: hypothetical protein R3B09_18705 [Nannocystaceae bacterium]